MLAGYLRDDRRNNESALKYFLLGSFATAFLLYGVAWTYGLTGSTNLDEIHRVLSSHGQSTPPVLIGLACALIFVGLAFKVSAAPFQMWAPDVYQGASSPVTAFMSAAPKAAAFAVFLRVFTTAFGTLSPRWVPLIWSISLLTMIIGNFAALTQTNVKRLLAYSSIAHAGYILVAFTADSQLGVAAVMFYLASYALMNVGAFAVISHVSSKHEQYVRIEDLSGLAKHLRIAFQPIWAVLDDLVLTVAETDFVWEEQVVYHQLNKAESLAWGLFKDGMRSLTIRRGAEQEELPRFLETINRARFLPADAGDDLLTLLWEQEFEFIAVPASSSSSAARQRARADGDLHHRRRGGPSRRA